MTGLDSLFSPFTLNGLTIPNRIVMAPMTRSFSPNGVPTDDVAAYYRRRIEGGVGLIITEGTTVDHDVASFDPNVPNFHAPEALAGWRKVVDSVHDAGGLIMPQLWHVGTMRREGTGPHPDKPSAGPSGLKYAGKKVAEPMTPEEVAHVVDAFGRAAESARELGFDGAEIHGAHGYLIDQFFWQDTNLREDDYGGAALAARTRFATDIIRNIRRRVGDDFPLILRFSQWKQQDFEHIMAATPDLLKAFCQPLIDAGIDCLHCSTRRFWLPEFEGSDLNLAGWVKKLTGLPTITVGSVGLDGDFIAAFQGESAQSAPIDELLERLNRDEFDLIAVGRALLSDPDWANKIRAGDLASIKSFTKDSLAALT